MDLWGTALRTQGKASQNPVGAVELFQDAWVVKSGVLGVGEWSTVVVYSVLCVFVAEDVAGSKVVFSC